MSWGERRKTQTLNYLIVLTRASSWGLSSPLCVRVHCCLCIFVSRSQLNFFTLSYPASTAWWSFHLSSIPPIRTRCRFTANAFLILTRASLIILHLFVCLFVREFFFSFSFFFFFVIQTYSINRATFVLRLSFWEMKSATRFKSCTKLFVF